MPHVTKYQFEIRYALREANAFAQEPQVVVAVIPAGEMQLQRVLCTATGNNISQRRKTDWTAFQRHSQGEWSAAEGGRDPQQMIITIHFPIRETRQVVQSLEDAGGHHSRIGLEVDVPKLD
jgi:hypothetical protein